MKVEEHPFFKTFSPEEAQNLIKQITTREYQAGDVIFEEGAPSGGIYFILEGEILFTKRLNEYESQSLNTSGPGTFFGEVGAFTGEPRSAAAQAKTKVRLGHLNKEQLQQFIENTPKLVLTFFQSIINHLHGITGQYVKDMIEQEKLSVVGSMVQSLIEDFNTPFNVISLSAQMLACEVKNEKALHYCQSIEQQIDHMVKMANDISDYVQGQKALKIERFLLSELFGLFQELNPIPLEDENYDITINTEDTLIEGDKHKLLRAIQSLVYNATQALKKDRVSGEPRGHITITGKPDGNEVLITVEDNANGIPQKFRADFFKPFSGEGKENNIGLGPAIAKSMIEAHKGTIHFETETNKGTTLFVRIPQKQEYQAVS
tara:strand:+ start:66134 stop:67258 length:1125 start_codon:yes stop_codon:yes gene_type:complete